VKGKSHDRFGWFAGFRDQRDLAAVSANNPSRNAQPQAAAIDLAASCFAAKKGIEDVLKHFRLDSRARVGDAQFNLAIDFLERDRGFMDSIYLQDSNGLKIELACYKFETPEGFRAADVLMAAQRLRVERGDHHITEEHLADAIESLLLTRDRL